MNNNIFNGPFKDYLYQYYEYKIKLGYNYYSQKSKLVVFDNYTLLNNSDAKVITKKILENFLNSKNIKQCSKSAYASVLRQFAKYLVSNGIEAYVIPNKKYKRGNETHIPHIFTKEELTIFFKTLENFYYTDTYKNLVVNAIFNLLYSTGLRVSECVNIKIEDIDFNNNSITIHNTKNTETRIIVISEKLMQKLNYININYNQNYKKEDYFFRHGNGTKYTPDSIYSCFRKILHYSKIKHTENGPRLHDFRHTFCVLSLKQAVENGIDINSYLPILSTYVGHTKISSTAYYLRLTSDMYPSIRTQIEKYGSNLILEMEDLEDE